jgi:ribosomal protein S18 acetylase RimI-like enzyme
MTPEKRKQAQRTVRVGIAEMSEDLPALRALFLDYESSLSVDLCFQNFELELRDLPGDYGAPRGVLLLATVDGIPAGCCALRPLDAAHYPNACEMKRLFVRPDYRGLRLGHKLAEQTMDFARLAGYQCILLDTLDDMEAARALYQGLGFKDIPPYYHNPISGAHYLKAEL